MDYPAVKKSHIVPRCLLKAFADSGRVELAVDGDLLPGTVPLGDVATRRYFYRRHRPDGTPIHDAEWSLARIENAAAPLLAELPRIWDELDLESKGKLAEFLAVQYVRGPRWKGWWEEQTRSSIDSWRKDPQPVEHNGLLIPVTQSAINAFEDQALTNTQWLTRMLAISHKVVGIFGSMHWTLLEFDGPCLLISDHPVVDWPLDAPVRRPEPNRVGVGALNFLEVRVPVAPDRAILMSWSDETALVSRMRGSIEAAENLNAFSIANSERQWLRQPGSDTPVGGGLLAPISPTVLDGYSVQMAESSAIRKAVTENLQPKLGVTDDAAEVDIFTSAPHPDHATD